MQWVSYIFGVPAFLLGVTWEDVISPWLGVIILILPFVWSFFRTLNEIIKENEKMETRLSNKEEVIQSLEQEKQELKEQNRRLEQKVQQVEGNNYQAGGDITLGRAFEPQGVSNGESSSFNLGTNQEFIALKLIEFCEKNGEEFNIKNYKKAEKFRDNDSTIKRATASLYLEALLPVYELFDQNAITEVSDALENELSYLDDRAQGNYFEEDPEEVLSNIEDIFYEYFKPPME